MIADDIYDLQCSAIKTDQYSRRENLVITGIPDSITNQVKLQQNVLDILHKIGLKDVTPYQITACHRLKKKKENFPAPTIVRFTNRKIVEVCLKNKDRLNNKKLLKLNLRFFENLCYENERIVNKCTYLVAKKQIFDYKTNNGMISIIATEGAKPKKIHHPDDLYDFEHNRNTVNNIIESLE